jgi:hypothetical protein
MPTMIEDIVCHFNSSDRRGSRVTSLHQFDKKLEIPARNSPVHVAMTPEQIAEIEILVLVEKFGFAEEEARSLMQRNKYLKDIESLKWIPRSLLVQTFMRKLLNES